MLKRSSILKRSAELKREILNREIFKRDTFKRDASERDDGKPGHSIALTRTHKISIAGVATLGAAAVALSLVPGGSGSQAKADTPAGAPVTSTGQIKDVHGAVTDRSASADQTALVAKAKAEQIHTAQQAASRSVPSKVYKNNLDGWIRESLDVMKKHKIPGSYNGLYRNIIRESSGNPMAINNWDINARNGIPSKGLLQVIPPTFKTYHVPGTSWNIYDPVANITAAANYAADRYGSMDNVNGAY